MSIKKVNIKNIMKRLVQDSAPVAKELRYKTEIGELTFKVYPVISYKDRIAMVRDIVDGVFMGEKNTIDCYMPEFLSLVQRNAVVSYFTDLKLPEKLEEAWLFLKHTTIYDDVVKIVGDEIQEIFTAADETIEVYKKYLTNKSDINKLVSRIGLSLEEMAKNMPEVSADGINVDGLNDALKANGINIDLNGILGSILKPQGNSGENKQ
ncbi:MAG: hypothetical protein ACI4M6_05535 [Christensenellaceae bacterium]